ncbi:MAG: zinc-ribbon domain-containing protein [Gammaproteobacteria bacterium]|nr:zinc-ribbon domain-containing protein [Gammaproteobacteria bacterium]
MYTRCPKCSTCFRVTDRHLAIAKGKVRCGKCQLVFNAPEHAIDDLPTKTHPAQAEIKKPVTNEEKNSISSTQTEKVIATPDRIEQQVRPAEVKKEEARVTPASKVPSPKVAPPLFQADATVVVDTDKLNKDARKAINLETPATSHHDAFHIDDDSFDDEFDLDAAINELTHAAEEVTYDYGNAATTGKNSKAKQPASIPPSEKFQEKNPAKERHDVFSTDAYDATNATSVADILNEMEGQLSLNIDEPQSNLKDNYDADDEFEFIELDDEPESGIEGHANQETNDEFIKNNFDIEKFGFEDDDIFEDEKPTKEKSKKLNRDERVEEDHPDEIDLSGFEESEITENIVLDKPHSENIGQHSADYEVPLRLRNDIENLHATPPRRLHPLFKISFIIILFVLSFSQVAYFRAYELVNIIPDTRPLLEQFCDNIGCHYSGPRDTKQIELVSRDVRLHPKEKNALLISAAMINNAYFSQPYPAIHIRLSDISGNIVAERIFSPKTYMGKLNNPFLLMRSKTPVHINFEVVDPGKDAVNFEFTFL